MSKYSVGRGGRLGGHLRKGFESGSLLRIVRRLALMTGLSFLLAACAGGGTANTTSPTTSPVLSTTVPNGTETTTSWSDIVTAATEEGRVVYYSIDLPPVVDAVVAAFSEAYPDIEIEAARGPTAEMETRLAQEIESGVPTADVYVSVNPLTMQTLSDEGRLLQIVAPTFLELQEEGIYADNPELAPGGDRATTTGVPYFIVWNTDLVEKPIEGYTDIVERSSEFGDGRLAAPGWISENAGLFYSIIEEGESGVDLTDDIEAGDWLTRFAKLEPSLYPSGLPIAQAVASGEAHAGIYAPSSAYLPLAAEGAPIDGMLSAQSVTSANFMAMALATGENPNAAQVLIDFMLTEEGQRVAAEAGGGLSIRPNMPGASGGPEFFKVPRPGLTDPDYLERHRNHWEQVVQPQS